MKPNYQISPAKAAQVNKRATAKKKKAILISSIAAVLVIAIVIMVIALGNKKRGLDSTRITTYNIEEITYGNVNTTISASGSLTPITKETLTVLSLLEEIEETATASADDSSADGLPSMNPDGITMPEIIGGTVDDVKVTVGDTVEEGQVLATIEFEDASLEKRNIIAPYDAVILELYLHEGDEVTDETSVAMFMGTDGYTMTFSVDENNISLIELGQEVEVSIDVIDNAVADGWVSDISYNGSTSGSTTAYGIEITFDYVEGTYPGMSVSAEIVIEASGNGLLVPVSAVYTSGDTSYIYLAPSDAALGDEYEEDDLNVSKLSKAIVTTGMSDGSYIMIENSALSEGDLIVITTITSTQTGSSGSGSGGGMGGGSMPNFGGGSMPDFGGSMPDFGNMPNFGGGSFPFG